MVRCAAIALPARTHWETVALAVGLIAGGVHTDCSTDEAVTWLAIRKSEEVSLSTHTHTHTKKKKKKKKKRRNAGHSSLVVKCTSWRNPLLSHSYTRPNCPLLHWVTTSMAQNEYPAVNSAACPPPRGATQRTNSLTGVVFWRKRCIFSPKP